MPHKFIISILVSTLIIVNISGVDRYANETEYVFDNTQIVNKIIKYSYHQNSKKNVIFETSNSTGDPIMYIWSENEKKQVAKDDNSGSGLNAKVEVNLKTGDYTIFIVASKYDKIIKDKKKIKNKVIDDEKKYLAYENITVEDSEVTSEGSLYLVAGDKIVLKDKFESKEGSNFQAKIEGVNNLITSCSLNIDGSKVLSRRSTYGTRIDVWNLKSETRFRYKSLNFTDKVTGVLLNENGDLIGYGEDFVQASEDPGYLILGTTYPASNVEARLWYVEDNNLDYLALYGDDSGNFSSAKEAINTFASFFKKSTNTNQSIHAYPYQFIDDSFNYLDAVDFAIYHGHGDYQYFPRIEYEEGKDIFVFDMKYGSNNKTNQLSGDLEYLAFKTCLTVRIEDTNSLGWLVNNGWESYEAVDGTIQKGLFDGLHLVVGFHGDHKSYSHSGTNNYSNEVELYYFAKYLNRNYSIWKAWKDASIITTNIYEIYHPEIDLGEQSCIYIEGSRDETLKDRYKKDYKFGDQGYVFGVRKFHYDNTIIRK